MARVVPQWPIRKTQFFDLAPGGRFGVFGFGAVDLWNSRVAWIKTWTRWPAATQPNVIAVDAETEPGLTLFNLLDGKGKEFRGGRLPHYALAAYLTPLQRKAAVVLVDTIQAREILTLPTPHPVLSLVSGWGTLYALSELDTAAGSEERKFAVLSYDVASGTPLGAQPISLKYSDLTPPPNPERSQPFLTIDAEQGVQLNVVSGCPRCNDEKQSPLQWYRRNLREPTAWTAREVALEDRDALALVPPAFMPSIPQPLPPQLERDLSRLREAAIGWTKGPQQGTHFITGDAGRDCEWALLQGQRLQCGAAGQAAPPANNRSPSACRLEIDASGTPSVLGALPITCNAELLATAYDLSPDDWALVLPDGHFSGSVHMQDYLAFYRANGSLMNAADMAALRLTPSELARRIARRLQHECAP
ncbi:MAG TPA: hypothetical protein VJV78_08650 [Polyangiales bacterium]|nr:hypothetical protein [Polyangiales bacterium]